jgi:hypothetical protein
MGKESSSEEHNLNTRKNDPEDNLTEEERRLQQIREILTYQMDLEILHKWREVRVIEEEIERGQQLQTFVEKLAVNGITTVRGLLIFLRVCIWKWGGWWYFFQFKIHTGQ